MDRTLLGFWVARIPLAHGDMKPVVINKLPDICLRLSNNCIVLNMTQHDNL
jgi:hypothetical protein